MAEKGLPQIYMTRRDVALAFLLPIAGRQDQYDRYFGDHGRFSDKKLFADNEKDGFLRDTLPLFDEYITSGSGDPSIERRIEQSALFMAAASGMQDVIDGEKQSIHMSNGAFHATQATVNQAKQFMIDMLEETKTHSGADFWDIPYAITKYAFSQTCNYLNDTRKFISDQDLQDDVLWDLYNDDMSKACYADMDTNTLRDYGDYVIKRRDVLAKLKTYLKTPTPEVTEKIDEYALLLYRAYGHALDHEGKPDPDKLAACVLTFHNAISDNGNAYLPTRDMWESVNFYPASPLDLETPTLLPLDIESPTASPSDNQSPIRRWFSNNKVSVTAAGILTGIMGLSFAAQMTRPYSAPVKETRPDQTKTTPMVRHPLLPTVLKTPTDSVAADNATTNPQLAPKDEDNTPAQTSTTQQDAMAFRQAYARAYGAARQTAKDGGDVTFTFQVNGRPGAALSLDGLKKLVTLNGETIADDYDWTNRQAVDDLMIYHLRTLAARTSGKNYDAVTLDDIQDAMNRKTKTGKTVFQTIETAAPASVPAAPTQTVSDTDPDQTVSDDKPTTIVSKAPAVLSVPTVVTKTSDDQANQKALQQAVAFLAASATPLLDPVAKTAAQEVSASSPTDFKPLAPRRIKIPVRNDVKADGGHRDVGKSVHMLAEHFRTRVPGSTMAFVDENDQRHPMKGRLSPDQIEVVATGAGEVQWASNGATTRITRNGYNIALDKKADGTRTSETEAFNAMLPHARQIVNTMFEAGDREVVFGGYCNAQFLGAILAAVKEKGSSMTYDAESLLHQIEYHKGTANYDRLLALHQTLQNDAAGNSKKAGAATYGQNARDTGQTHPMKTDTVGYPKRRPAMRPAASSYTPY